MVIRRAPRNLPGKDPLFLQRILVAFYLTVVAGSLVLNIADAVEIDVQRGHLPWPIAQWALTTPLGALAVAAVSGLVWGFPLALVVLARPLIIRPLDVTDLPLSAWPGPLPLWRDPGSATLADVWLGRGQRQRALSLLALTLAVLLLIGLLALFVASGWYGFTGGFPDCGASGCPPNFTGQFSSAPEFIRGRG